MSTQPHHDHEGAVGKPLAQPADLEGKRVRRRLTKTETESRSFRSRLHRGAAWSAIDVGVSRFSSFLLGLVVARLLVPADFGVFAVALVVHAIVINVSELGVSTSLVRCDADGVERTAPTVVTIALVSSALLGALMAFEAPALARLLGTSRATDVIRVMALTLPLAGISAVPSALLRREFRTDKLFVADIANLVVTYLVVIPLAMDGWGAMALAWSWVASQLATTLILVAFMPAHCRPGFDRKQVRDLLAFGVPLAAANILSFGIQNVDYVVVGRLLGSTRLGLYVLAFNISGWPMSVFSSVVRSVALPAFARLREDAARLPTHFFRAVNTVGSITFPVCLLLSALAYPLVKVLYGSRWSGASAALVGLALLGALRTVIEPFADFLVALGRTRAVLIAQVPWLVGLTVGLLVAVPIAGIAGAGAVQAVVAAAIVIPVYMFFLRSAGIGPSIVLRALGPPLAWSTMAGVVAWLVASQFGNPWLACIAGGCSGCLMYLLPNYGLIRRLIAHVMRKRKHGVVDDNVACAALDATRSNSLIDDLTGRVARVEA